MLTGDRRPSALAAWIKVLPDIALLVPDRCREYPHRESGYQDHPRKYYEELMEISGDKGGKKIIKKHPEDVAYLQIRNARELQDADEPDVFTAGNLR